jgi:Peroxidase, family 2
MTISKLFEKDYWKDSMSLADFNAHNIIEHDGSIVRDDALFQPDQGVPSVDVINGLLRSASGTATIGRQKVKVCIRGLGVPWEESEARNEPPLCPAGFDDRRYRCVHPSTQTLI